MISYHCAADATQPHGAPVSTPIHPQQQPWQYQKQADVPSLCWLKTQDGGIALSLCAQPVAAKAEAAG
jgi:hypothetical protein